MEQHRKRESGNLGRAASGLHESYVEKSPVSRQAKDMERRNTQQPPTIGPAGPMRKQNLSAPPDDPKGLRNTGFSDYHRTYTGADKPSVMDEIRENDFDDTQTMGQTAVGRSHYGSKTR